MKQLINRKCLSGKMENIMILLCSLCSIHVLLLVKYNLVLRYEARVNPLRVSSF